MWKRNKDKGTTQQAEKERQAVASELSIG